MTFVEARIKRKFPHGTTGFNIVWASIKSLLLHICSRSELTLAFSREWVAKVSGQTGVALPSRCVSQALEALPCPVVTPSRSVEVAVATAVARLAVVSRRQGVAKVTVGTPAIQFKMKILYSGYCRNLSVFCHLSQ